MSHTGWTPVDESAAKWTPIEEKKPERSFLGKLWDAVNTPIADFVLPKGVKTSDIFKGAAFEKMFGETYVPGVNDFDTKAQLHLGDSPTKAAVKTFLAGATADTASTAAGFTSPLSIGTAAAGAATKIPGAVGTLAKAATGAASAGFALKGAADIAEAGTENTPQAWQQRLAGGANLAGGLAGVSSTVKDIRTPEVASGLYTSAMKPSTTLSGAERARRVNAGLQNEIPVSPAGVDKLNALVDDLRGKVSAQLKTNPQATISKTSAASRLTDTFKTFSNQVAPESDISSIFETRNEFLRNQAEQIPALEAQALKTGTYKQLGQQAYGTMKAATVESQKALARGIKEELEAQFPEIKGLNAKEGELLGLEKSLQRAVNRIGNNEEFGIGTPIAAGGVHAMTGSPALSAAAGVLAFVLHDPMVKSKVAIALARKGVPMNAANARVAAYTNALANSVPRGNRGSGEEASQ